jgi:hypothetical protein
MNFKYTGENRRRSINSHFRKEIEDGIVSLRSLHCLLHQAIPQKIPYQSIRKLKESCLTLEKNLLKMGLPKLRIQEIIKQAN